MNDDGDLTKLTLGQVAGAIAHEAAQTPELKEAGRNIARAANVVTKTLEHAVLPLAAVNYGIEKARVYFQERFPARIADRAQRIPEENVQAPKASIAGPAVQALAFAHEEEELESLYLDLITTSMDSREADNAHPAFVEILRQLTASEARTLPKLLHIDRRQTACVSIRKMTEPIRTLNGEKRARGSFGTVATHLFNCLDTSGKPMHSTTTAPMVDNWVRLGLIEVSYDKWLTAATAYEWAENHPEVAILRKIFDREAPHIDIQRGLISPTSFGIKFGAAVKLWRAHN